MDATDPVQTYEFDVIYVPGRIGLTRFTPSHRYDYDLYAVDMLKEKIRIGIVTTDTNMYEIDFNKPGYDPCELETGHLEILEGLVASGGQDILVAPEYFFASRPPLDAGARDEIAERLKRASVGKDTLLIPGSIVWHSDGILRNTVPVMCDGKVVMEYEKRMGEPLIAELFSLAGRAGKTQGAFEWKGYRCGIELCSDHGELKREGITNLDFHFLVSCGRPPCSEYSVAREGGYLVYCDGANPVCGVYENTIKQKLLPISSIG